LRFKSLPIGISPGFSNTFWNIYLGQMKDEKMKGKIEDSDSG